MKRIAKQVFIMLVLLTLCACAPAIEPKTPEASLASDSQRTEKHDPDWR